MNKALVFVLACLLTVACSRPSAQQIHKDIDGSLTTNQKAKTNTEWESSDKHPEVIFANWKKADADPKDVCKSLDAQSAKDLTLFEEQIKDTEYADLVAPCKEELIKKMEAYWDQQKQNLKPVTSGDIEFPDTVKKIDTANGYKAVSGDLQIREVALTFDDGPHPQYTDQILAALKSVNAKAVFFEVGKNVHAHPEITRRVGAAGNSVGSHSVDHKCLSSKSICAKPNGGKLLTHEQGVAEISGGHQAVYEALGWVDPFFRFPYGESDPFLNQYLSDHEVGQFYWSIDSQDWKNQTPQQMIAGTMKQLDRLGTGIILFHDIQRKTAESLPTILKMLYAKGYSIVLLQPASLNDRTHSKLVNLKN